MITELAKIIGMHRSRGLRAPLAIMMRGGLTKIAKTKIRKGLACPGEGCDVRVNLASEAALSGWRLRVYQAELVCPGWTA